MLLGQYLRDQEIGPVEFARKAGVSFQTIYRLLAGGYPSAANALKIEAATGGQVKPNDLFRRQGDGK